SMKHRKLPASIHVRELNPFIKIDESPFYIVTKTQEWSPPASAGSLLRAGVSSFGFGGANAHIALECPPAFPPMSAGFPAYWLMLSAKTSKALKQKVSDFRSWLKGNPSVSLYNMMFTLLTGRDHYRCRVSWIVESAAELAGCLESWEAGVHEPNCRSSELQNLKAKMDKAAKAKAESLLRAMASQ